MAIGWIDYSQRDRNRVMNVMSLLSEPGTLDELGIAPIRDGFSNIFFPGITTIQTRAKYFLIVPYIMRDLELTKITDPDKLLEELDKAEAKCGQALLKQADNKTTGIIGGESLKRGEWVKRPPSVIYWSGLHRYGIFLPGNTHMNMSIPEYVNTMCKLKSEGHDTTRNGRLSDEDDDRNTGDVTIHKFWNLPDHSDKDHPDKYPPYKKGWMDDLNIDLTEDEATFLKGRIVETCPDSMLSHILSKDMRSILNVVSFSDLEKGIIKQFPDKIRQDYVLANRFSEFVFILRIVFNMIVSQGQSSRADDLWEECKKDLKNIAEKVNIDALFRRLHINESGKLAVFLKSAQDTMKSDEDTLETLKGLIKNREIECKHGESLAKTCNPEKYWHEDAWYGGERLDYRFDIAKKIIKDIFEWKNENEESGTESQ